MDSGISSLPAQSAAEQKPASVRPECASVRPECASVRHECASVPYVCVYASQVAGCIGANRHKKVSDAMMQMWQRIAPAGFRDAMRRNGLETEEDAVQRLVEKHEEVRALVEHSARVSTATSAEVASCYNGAQHDIENTTLGSEQKQLVDSVVKKNLYTAYGTRAETEMLRYIRDVMCIPCHADTAFYKQCQGEVDGVPWYVGGKIDAMSDDGHLLIEIKNRVNRLFHRAPAYEAVQVQTYMQLLDVHQAALIECFKGEGGAVQTNVVPIARDKLFWKHEVVPKLRRFVAFLVRLLRDTAVQDSFLASKRPSAMITHFATL
jgi:hypothetical protein